MVHYSFSEQVMAYSYCVRNKSVLSLDFTIDCSKSDSMLFSTREPVITRRVLPKQTVFLLYSRATPNCERFARNVRCIAKPVRA